MYILRYRIALLPYIVTLISTIILQVNLLQIVHRFLRFVQVKQCGDQERENAKPDYGRYNRVYTSGDFICIHKRNF